MRNAPVAALAVLSLALLVAAPNRTRVVQADPAPPKPDTIAARVARVTITKPLLVPGLQDHLQQEGFSLQETTPLLVELSAAIASGKASLPEGYFLNLPTGARVDFNPSSFKNQIGLDLMVGPPEPNGRLRAEVRLTYQTRIYCHTIVAPSGDTAVFRLSPDAAAATQDLAFLTLTRLPRR